MPNDHDPYRTETESLRRENERLRKENTQLRVDNEAMRLKSRLLRLSGKHIPELICATVFLIGLIIFSFTPDSKPTCVDGAGRFSPNETRIINCNEGERGYLVGDIFLCKCPANWSSTDTNAADAIDGGVKDGW